MKRVACAVLMIAVMTACGGGGADVPVAPPAPVLSTVTVTIAPTTIQLRQSASAQAELRTLAGAVLTGRAVSWSSSAPAVASVDASGVIANVSVGSATNTATSEDKSGSAPITVFPAPVASLTLTALQSSLTVGSSTQATAIVRSANGQVLADRVIAWSSSAPSVASVSSTGVILAIAPGVASISAASDGRAASIAMSVLAPTPATVTVSPSFATLAPSQSASLWATVRDASGM